MCTFRSSTHFMLIFFLFRSPRWISWTAGACWAAKVVAFIKNHYTKSYVINQQNYFSFSPSRSDSAFSCLNYAPAQEGMIPMRWNSLYRFTINHNFHDFLSSSFSSSMRRKQVYGAFLFISSSYFAFFRSLMFHIHTEQLLINHLFKLVYYVTSINYPFFRFVRYPAFDWSEKVVELCVFTFYFSLVWWAHQLTIFYTQALNADYGDFHKICDDTERRNFFSLLSVSMLFQECEWKFALDCASFSLSLYRKLYANWPTGNWIPQKIESINNVTNCS